MIKARASSLPPSGDHLLVSERFVSLQGEGVSQGVPSAFLRLGNCNLACSYCDTPYTWDEENYDLGAELKRFSIASVSDWVVQEAPGRLIITGGEPLIQQKLISRLLEQVDLSCKEKALSRVFVEVETNGTITPVPSLLSRVDQWNVSPKLECSAESRSRRIVPGALTSLRETGRAYFKFVITQEADVQEVRGLSEELRLPWDRVLFMPEARTVEELRARSGQVAQMAQKEGVRFSGRLHLELYGGRRGT